MSSASRLTPALIAIDALLAVALAALWLAPGTPARWRHWQPPAPQAPNLEEARAARLAPNPALRRDYPAITERPLFAADRKPHATASEPDDAAPPNSLEQAKLNGLVDGPKAQGALLSQNGQPLFVQVGERVGDWTLQAITGRDAIFVKAGERRVVSLPDSLTGPAGAASGVAAASAPASTSAPVSAHASVTAPASAPPRSAAPPPPRPTDPTPSGAPRVWPPAARPSRLTPTSGTRPVLTQSEHEYL